MPYALGVLNMSPQEFYDLTLAEYQLKCQEHLKWEKQKIWLLGAMVGRAFGATKENPYPSLEEFMNPKPQETDEELFEIAKEKGIEVPEGK